MPVHMSRHMSVHMYILMSAHASVHKSMQMFYCRYITSHTTSVPKLKSLGPCMWVPFGTCTTKIAEFRFVAGPRCNRTIGNRGSPKKILKKTGVIYRIGPPKRLFSGVFGISFLCRANANLHRGRRLGIWGIDCAHIKAIVPPNLLRKTFYISEKTQKRPEYCLI